MAKRPKKVVKNEVKKRVDSKLIPKQNGRKRPDPEPEPPKLKPQRELKFVKIAIDAPQSEFKVMGDRVQAGELTWHHYALDGNKGYHYYLVLPKI